ncbi:glucan biosynthesis protein [Paracoccus sp. MBLB3053]|uniref:Glucan biosynthesis protein n=1 Tax=Paracoccus aurantius TaxID=3073814 RepID=A0ABU2HVI3_9RHOB|nr:glucan biosynthesis protein [Paracoccus sp. MBLB3053]MDS9469062.1 glucan biosynthesis protein [Paracoccus sp. MBLB3053]
MRLRKPALYAALAAITLGQPVLPIMSGPARAEQAAGKFAPELGQSQVFSFDELTSRARAIAAEPYVPPNVEQPEVLEKIDYDAHWKIAFRPETTVRVGDVPVQFFHLGTYFRNPVKISVVENGKSREIGYDPAFFDMPEDSPAHELTRGTGFAGFRLMNTDLKTDWISFLGASYFRTSGPQGQYGMSARGLAINSGMTEPEEFPSFTEFYIEKPKSGQADVTIYALMDSPSVAGAYRMDISKGGPGEGQRMEISSRLFFRNAVARLGIAPLTSMYWYSETNRVLGFDWRPEVHDADGLMMVTGNGEQIWRPLMNPPRVVTSSYVTENPQGFGLLQRDRRFENYEDDGVFYEKRASVWIAPKGDWGKGQVQLVEIPTDDEIYDNIVSFWNPEQQPQAGQQMDFDYTLTWMNDAPVPQPLARTVATRIGAGGVPGHPRPKEHLKIAIDFEGPTVSGLGQQDGVEPVVTVPEGVEIVQSYALPVVGTGRWRMIFDIAAEGVETADIRAYLVRDGQPLTETWLGQVHPAQFDRIRPGAGPSGGN